MLGFLTGKPNHPLADARESRKIIANLTTMDPRAAVDEAGNWLESLATADGFKLALRLERVLQIDEATIQAARRLGREYMTQGSTSRVQEFQLWKVNHDYWHHLVSAYTICLVWQQTPGKEADSIKSQLGMLFGRMINALAAHLKWVQFRYEPVQPEFWTTLGDVYLSACAHKVNKSPVMLYPNGSETTIEAEYLRALLFQASSMDNLLPLEIELAERFIAYFLPFFALIHEVRPDNVYWVDAAKPLPPTRLARLPEVTPTLRFFNGTRALDAVEKTLALIRTEQRVPAGINLGAQFSAQQVIPVLEHLAMCWSPKPPMRTSTRHRIKSRMLVGHGLTAIHRRLCRYERNLPDAESWVVDDISMGGMGAQVPITHNDWIRIGVLICMQPEGGDNWLIGIVRRYVRTSATQGSVGIETISKAPLGVVADADGLHTEVVLLDALVVGETARMALQPQALEERVPLLFSVEGKHARLYPLETQESGADYVIVKFMVQSFN